MGENRVLFIRGGGVGDFVLTLPLLRALGARHPRAQVDILGYPAIGALAVDGGLASTVWRVDAAWAAPMFSPAGRPGGQLQQFVGRYDAVACVWPDGDGAIETSLRASGVRRLAMVDPLPPETGDRHAIDHAADQMQAVGVPVADRSPRLSASAESESWARRVLAQQLPRQRPVLGMHMGSGSRAKNWPHSNFVAVARAWLARTGGGVLLTRGPAEEGVPEPARPGLPSDRRAVLAQASLPHMAAALAACDAYVGNDSGITHLAAAVGTPTVAVFGPTRPKLWGPRGPKVSIVTPRAGDDFPMVPQVLDALFGLVA